MSINTKEREGSITHEAEVRYLPLEKAILAIVYATRKLPHYF